MRGSFYSTRKNEYLNKHNIKKSNHKTKRKKDFKMTTNHENHTNPIRKLFSKTKLEQSNKCHTSLTYARHYVRNITK